MLMTGVAVRVQSVFDGRWVDGFEAVDVFDHEDDRYFVLRRRSDGSILPVPLPAARVRLPGHAGV